MTKRFSVSLVFVLLILIVLSACNAAGGTPANPDVLTQEPVATLDPGQPTPVPATGETPVAGVEACPAEQPGQKLFVNEASGYCFLYPDTFTANTEQAYQADVNIVGQPLAGDTSMEPALAFMTVNTIAKPGAAAGITLDQYFAEAIASLGGDLASQVTSEPATIGGQPAIFAKGPFGRGSGREAFVIANNTIYVIFNDPVDLVSIPEIQADSDLVWNTVTQSMTFFTPQVVDSVLPEEVCPVAGEGQTLYVSKVHGLCFLVPSAYTLDTMIPGTFYGGPEIPSLPEYVYPQYHVSVTAASAGPAQGKTAAQFADERITNAPDPSVFTREDITVSGVPAVVLNDTSDPIGQPTAFVVVNDTFYTILLKPGNYTLYPEAEAPGQELWNSVLTTIQFFDPWN
jgi:hypothetical protein